MTDTEVRVVVVTVTESPNSGDRPSIDIDCPVHKVLEPGRKPKPGETEKEAIDRILAEIKCDCPRHVQHEVAGTLSRGGASGYSTSTSYTPTARVGLGRPARTPPPPSERRLKPKPSTPKSTSPKKPTAPSPWRSIPIPARAHKI